MISTETLVITVDGPAASGKSTLSRGLAKKLSGKWVSTGAFYRGLAYVAQQEDVDLTNESLIADLCLSSKWQVQLTPELTRVIYNKIDVSAEIYGESVGAVASKLSQFQKARANLLAAQRACSEPGSILVAEGRDCGTKVFPQAFLKIYLTASATDRTARRSLESGESVEQLEQKIKHRDQEDSSRKHSPLEASSDSVNLDSSGLSKEKVVDEAFELFKAKYRDAFNKDFKLS